VAAAADGKSRADGARRRCVRQFVTALVFVWLTYMVDTSVIVVPVAVSRRSAVALLSAACVAMLIWAAASWASHSRTAAASFLGLASAADLPRSAEQVRGLMRQEVMARYGQAVWPHLARRRQVARLGLAAVCGFVLASFVYANVSHDSRPPLIAGAVTVGAAVLATRVVRRETELSLQATEQALGGHALTASSTRWQPDEYVAWCQARNIEPYPHGRPASAR
jgi:hypothetical protein